MLFKESGEPRAIGRDPLHALQLLPDPKDASCKSRDGCRVTDRLWSISDMVTVLEAWEAKQQEAA
jgi:hypothetical protein